MKKAILNMEYEKLELHFEKAEYDALSDEEKRELKSAFLWSRKANAWVSRAKYPNILRAERVAEKLGFEKAEREGQRISYAEQQERKAERAERRADRYEGYAAKAEENAAALQKPFKEAAKDIAWLTQPIINSPGGRAFQRSRERIMKKYERGYEELNKSEYFKDRAATARETASMSKMKDPVYLEKKIAESDSLIKKLNERSFCYEGMLKDIQDGTNNTKPAEEVESWLDNTLERLEYEVDKRAYFQKALDDIGGIRFSRETVKKGYIVDVARWGRVKVTSTGPKNFNGLILDGGAANLPIKDSYAAIKEILEAGEERNEENHPYKVGMVLAQHTISGDNIIRAFKVTKATAKTITLMPLVLDKDGKPTDEFKGQAIVRKPAKSVYDGSWKVYYNDWPLYEYKDR